MGEPTARNIRVFCRIRPSAVPSGFLSIDGGGGVEWRIPPDVDTGLVNNNAKSSHNFKFDSVLDAGVKQDEVFTQVVSDSVEDALNGYNATIFAYGQTGSGKTFTMTGGASRYDDRGLIPRALARIFSAAQQRAGVRHLISASYMEIYNEVGYDLLAEPAAGASIEMLEQLPRVSLQEDEEGTVHLRGLSQHAVVTEEEALNLLFLGDTNRAIAETPMNMASSRSHCIFTVCIESREEGSSVVKRSKLHFVDLAGSERAHKSQASGVLLREATHINKSLHFLELVIVALQEARRGTRSHIPYRNSMMTSVLRDSLGGNCRTSMIATLNPEVEHTDESITTCRFAQRVGGITNVAVVNEAIDPQVAIRLLKARVHELEVEVEVLSNANADSSGNSGGGGGGQHLSDDDAARIAAAARQWASAEPSDTADLLQSMGAPLSAPRIRRAMTALRDIIRASEAALACCAATTVGVHAGAVGVHAGAVGVHAGAVGANQLHPQPPPSIGSVVPPQFTPDEVRALQHDAAHLRAQLASREIEIAVLMTLLKKDGRAKQLYGKPLQAPQHDEFTVQQFQVQRNLGEPSSAASNDPHHSPEDTNGFKHGARRRIVQLPNGTEIPTATMADREASFVQFRASNPAATAMEENKRVLRDKLLAAKSAAEELSVARSDTAQLKGAIESHRLHRSVEALSAGRMPPPRPPTRDGTVDEDPEEADETERQLTVQLDGARNGYSRKLSALRVLKSDIERIQLELESDRRRLQREFEEWYTEATAECEDDCSSSNSSDDRMKQVAPPEADHKGVNLISLQALPAAAAAASATWQENRPGETMNDSAVNRKAAAVLSVQQQQQYQLPGTEPRTGVAEVDEDIAAFYAARNALRRRQAAASATAAAVASTPTT